MRRLILWLVVVVFVVAVLGPVLWGFGVRAAPPKPDDAGAIMQKKLAHSQKLLEGIALADLDKVGEQARELAALSKQAEFRVLKTAQYELHANEFLRALEDIQKGVKQKNLDAAALGYLDMTMTCVRCHKHVREVRMAWTDGPADGRSEAAAAD
jgi:cytochrome c553